MKKSPNKFAARVIAGLVIALFIAALFGLLGLVLLGGFRVWEAVIGF